TNSWSVAPGTPRNTRGSWRSSWRSSGSPRTGRSARRNWPDCRCPTTPGTTSSHSLDPMENTEAVDLQVRRLSPSVGAEISGVDVRALTPADVPRIRGLFLQHHLLVFADQHLTDADLQRFAEHFGPLEGNNVRGVDGAVLPPVHRI